MHCYWTTQTQRDASSNMLFRRFNTGGVARVRIFYRRAFPTNN